MNRLKQYLSWSQPLRIKVDLLVVVTLSYLVVFLFITRTEGYRAAAPFAIVPAIISGLLLSTRAVVVYVLLLVVFTTLLGISSGYPFPNVLVSVTWDVFLFICAIGSGWLREQLAGRERISLELEASEERLRSLITSAPVILFAINREGIFTLSEGSALAILGLQPGEAVGQSVYELFAKAEPFLVEVRRALAGESFTSISRGRGRAFETRYSPQYDKDGQFIGTIGVSVDVLSRVEAEAAYRTVVETSIQGLVILQDRRLVFANAALAEMSGYSVEELLAMTPQQTIELAYPDDRELVAHRLQAHDEGKPLSPHVEIRMIRKDGTVRWMEMYSAPIDYRGKPAMQIVALDVTERKMMEAALIETESLRLALDQERELKELKGRFISMVSHQFRTPMSVISTTSFLLENYHERLPAEKREDYFNKIRSQINRLDEMIENVLTISRTEANRLDFAPHFLDLEALCHDLLAEMQLTAAPQHKLVFKPEGDLSAAFVDENLVRHILTNLLSNSIKYSPDGGDVIFSLERRDDEVIFQISDFGIGILPDDQKHLFEPFHRGQNVGSIKGSGLGLKIVKDFVDLHGGTISCKSEPGKGTTFTVRLPVVQPEAQAEGQGLPDSTLSSGGA